MDRNLATLSKFLAKHLRHAPEALGLTFQPGGWVSVDDLLAASQRAGFSISYDELIECVETNDKKRFSFDDTGDLIRANQGHSVEVDLQLEQKEPPEVLYHGTVERFLASIMSEGLKKGRRHDVHLSKDVETAGKVGARCGKPVILKVDAANMHRQGFKFFLSVNGVWLTGWVPVRVLGGGRSLFHVISRKRPRHTETVVVVNDCRRSVVSVGGPHLRHLTAVRATTQYMPFSVVWTFRINHIVSWIVVVPVRTPLPNIAVHVVKTPLIAWEPCDR